MLCFLNKGHNVTTSYFINAVKFEFVSSGLVHDKYKYILLFT